jgi:Cu+-exporting ATPase
MIFIKIMCAGDGINDSPALAQSNLGLSVGAGSDIAMEAASIILMKNDLRDVLTALDLSRTTFQRIKINFMWVRAEHLCLCVFVCMCYDICSVHGVLCLWLQQCI